MRRTAVLVASAAFNAHTIPALGSACTSIKGIDASRWATLRSELANATGKEKICRAYAASFYESVTLRQAAAKCFNGKRNVAVLDSEINALNDLLAAKCGD